MENKKLAEITINVGSSKNAIIYYVQMVLMKQSPNEAEKLTEIFTQEYERLLLEHSQEDTTDLARYYRLVMQFKPALLTIVQPGPNFDEICDLVVTQFNVILNRVREQVKDNRRKIQKPGPILPGTNQIMELKYYCSVCKQEFDIPPEIQAKLLNSDEKMEMPKHHEKEMEIRIKQPPRVSPEPPENKPEKIEIYSAELLMGHVNTENSNVEYLKVLSVGIDVGSSTSHLVFSQLTLRRETSFFNMSNHFILVNREIIYEGNIIFTPLLDVNTIDIEAVIKFCEEEYQKAGITPEMVETGAVIVTGETAKKQNAAEIVRRLSSASGKFVSASAGPNFESLLAIMGSGIVKQSLKQKCTYMNVDIGGGTSNIAIASQGYVHSTACSNVGGRLLGIESNFKIWRIDDPTNRVMQELGMKYQIGDRIPELDVIKIAKAYAEALMEVMLGPATTPLGKYLLMTEDLDFSLSIDGYSFSGGIAELIYSDAKGSAKTNQYRDIGYYLAEEINILVKQNNLPIVEPDYKIRATVIGAGAFSLSVSGSTCYYDPNITLPLENIPVVPIHMNFNDFATNKQNLPLEIALALKKFDLQEGVDKYALYFKDQVNRRDLPLFAKEIEKSLPNSLANKKLILLILGCDGGKMLGITLKKETAIKENIFCLDELQLETGDWIDIGTPLSSSQAFPITIKSLVFNQAKSEKRR